MPTEFCQIFQRVKLFLHFLCCDSTGDGTSQTLRLSFRASVYCLFTHESPSNSSSGSWSGSQRFLPTSAGSLRWPVTFTGRRGRERPPSRTGRARFLLCTQSSAHFTSSHWPGTVPLLPLGARPHRLEVKQTALASWNTNGQISSLKSFVNMTRLTSNCSWVLEDESSSITAVAPNVNIITCKPPVGDNYVELHWNCF